MAEGRQLEHVGLLVTDVVRAAAAFACLGCELAPPHDFVDEGTREIYVGAAGEAGRLLLLQPIGAGPYARALSIRGPGLHHIAIATRDVARFVQSITGTGWYLHPCSMESLGVSRTVWLARPGMPLLVEVL